MADLSYKISLSDPGHYRFVMPEGFDDAVEVHLWGAGGGYGAGGAAGGGGGYVKSTVYISAGATVDIGVGGEGQSAADVNTAGVGGVSMTSKYRGGSGGGRGGWCGNVNGPMASAGGGGATAIDVNGTAAAVAGGGGGGGGYGHKGAKYGGYPAGVYPDWIVSGTNGANASWGGGGAGGFNGGASGYASGHAVIGGNGGTNFGTLAVPGDGAVSGGADYRVVFDLPPSIGNASYNGYAILIFTRKKTLSWKRDSGNVRVVLSNVATISTGSIVQQEYTESAQGNAIVKQGTTGGNTIIVSYLDSNVFVNNSGNIASGTWTGNLIILEDDVDSNVYPISTTALGDWVSVANVYYKTTTSGVLNNSSFGELTSQSFTSAGTYTFTVPTNVRRITVKASGAGGGGGGNDSKGGASGVDGSLITSTIDVIGGATYTIMVGQGGRGGATTPGTGGAPGGAGGSGYASGGAGSSAGPSPWSGGGGGGGGASGIVLASTPLVVAAGGGGGGGAGNHSNGQGVYPGGYSASPTGNAGTAKGGDGGGAGGGGGGYPLGGEGGAAAAGDNGGYSGAIGKSYPTSGLGYSLLENGGGIGGSAGGGNGSDGFLEISYNVYYYTPGTWVPVETVYYKNNGTWQNLLSDNNLQIAKIG
jgi:hypothetical protein